MGGALAAAARDGPHRRGDRPRLDLGRRPPALSRRRATGARAVGGVDHPGGDRRGHGARRDRAARGGDQLPQPRPAGQAGRDRGRDQRRAADPGPGRRLERGGVRAPTASRSTIGSAASRRRSPSSAACWRRPMRLPRHLLRPRRLRAPAARAAPPTRRGAAADGRLDRGADALDHPPPRAGLERVVHLVRQHGRGLPADAGRRRCRVPRGGPRPRRRWSGRSPSSSPSPGRWGAPWGIRSGRR